MKKYQEIIGTIFYKWILHRPNFANENINTTSLLKFFFQELGNTENTNESQPVAPLSVQPTRKVKASSLGVNALKRL